MRYYTMLYACHDAMTKVLLEKEIENYKEKYFNKTPNITRISILKQVRYAIKNTYYLI